jgi:hypothetical protein
LRARGRHRLTAALASFGVYVDLLERLLRDRPSEDALAGQVLRLAR